MFVIRSVRSWTVALWGLCMLILCFAGRADTIVPTGATWKFLDNGSNQGTAWRELGFADTSWAAGPAELGYGDGDEATVVSYGPSSTNKYITTYFRRSFTINAPEAWASLSLDLVRDDGAVVYLNGTEVFRSNMPTGAITYTTLASSAPAEPIVHQITNTVSPALFIEGTNVLAVEIHQAAVDSSDISFSLAVTGTLKPASVASVLPAANASGVLVEPTLTARATSASGAALAVSFYGRLAGAASYTLLQTNAGVVSGSTTNITWPDLSPHANYEWYAVATQGADTAQSAVRQFTTGPMVVLQALTTEEETNLAVVLSGNAADPTPLTFSIVTQPAHGTLSGSAPNIIFTPALNYVGQDTFTFRATDGFAFSPPATISVTITPINDSPIALTQSVSTTQETPVLINAASDPDGDPLTFTYTLPPAHGSLTQSGGNLTYTPAMGYQGPDSFQFSVSDGILTSAEATISITVLPPNEPPVALSQSLNTPEDATLGITLAATDVDNNPLSYSIVSGPTNGVLSGSGATRTYTPTLNYNGPDTFTFRANDGLANSNVATISLTVTPVNDAPTAQPQSVTLDKNTAVQITLSGTDLEGDTLTYNVVSAPTHGNLLGTGAVRTYVPTTDYLGTDSFTFTANDGQATSAPVSISLNVQLLTGPTITRGPYLQSPAQDRITLRWRTSTATVGLVRYGSTATTLNTLALEPGNATTEHTVTLTGLAPDTPYFYSIGTALDTIVTGSDYFFRTHPTPGTTRTTRIWAIGDFGTADSNQIGVRNAFQAFQGSQPVDVWLMLGDNAYNNGTDSEYQASVFNIYPTMLRNTPVWSTFGNHEQGALSNANAGTAPYYSIFNFPSAGESGGVASGSEAYYSFDYGKIHFVCLDSQVANRTANGAMAQWLQLDLAANAQEWLIAFFHHPIYSGTTSHHSDVESRTLDMRQVFVPILENYGVDLVLSGHSHAYERSKLMDGHYGLSSTLNPTNMVKDGGDGNPAGNGAYVKNDAGRQGTVYTVAGNGGQTLDVIPTVHPVMVRSILEYGSVILDLDDHELTSRMLDKNGVIRDTFRITHNARPLAIAQARTLNEDDVTAVTLTGSDADAEPLTYSVVTAPLHGTLSGSGANIIYTPAANYFGPDSFTFKVNDGKRDSLPATVSLTITSVDDPVAIALEQPTGTALVFGISGVSFGAATMATPVTKVFTIRNPSPDNALTGIALSLSGGNAGDFSIVTAPPTSVAANGSATFSVRFTPQATGARSAVLSIANNDPDKNPWLLALSGIGNLAPLFPGYTLSMKSGQTTNLSLTKILAKASDPDGDPLAVTSVGTSQLGGSVTLSSANIIYAAPATAAVDTIPVTITDARGGTVSANLTINIVADTALANNVGQITLHPMIDTAEILFYGIPGRSYQIQHSSNLSTWSPKATVVADGLGRILWTDSGPLTSPGFYRTRPAP